MTDLQRYIKFGHDLNYLVNLLVACGGDMMCQGRMNKIHRDLVLTQKTCCLKIRLYNIQMVGSCDMPSTFLSPKKA